MKNLEQIEKKVFSYMEKHHMIAPGDKIVLGVSGGADSVCLLFLLLEYAKKVPLSLTVVHVNHGIRPDAGEDADYVQALCETYDLPFYPVEEDVPAKVRLEKCSEEDAGRRVRYEAFGRVASEVGATKIAVAHNCDDNAETMMLHLFRGSGLDGLCGIAPMRGVTSEVTADADNKRATGGKVLQLIRPILCLRRKEIEEYLKAREISWRNDSTNEQDAYTRNRIRHHITPYVEQHIVAHATDRMGRTAEVLQETADFLEQETMAALERCLCEEHVPEVTGGGSLGENPVMARENKTGRIVIHRDIFLSLHPAIQKRLLLKLAKELSPTGKDILSVHVEDMLERIRQEGNKSVNLPFGIVVRRQYDKVILEKGVVPKMPEFIRPDAGQEYRTAAINMDKDAVYELGEWGKLEISHLFEEKYQEVPTNQYTKWFDYDKIKECIEIRTRRQGDYFTISDGAGGSSHKSLKDYMITAKIPKELRDRIPVLAVGSHVLWLVGYRISEDFKVSENTGRIVQAKLITKTQTEQKTEEENGRAD